MGWASASTLLDPVEVISPGRAGPGTHMASLGAEEPTTGYALISQSVDLSGVPNVTFWHWVYCPCDGDCPVDLWLYVNGDVAWHEEHPSGTWFDWVNESASVSYTGVHTLQWRMEITGGGGGSPCNWYIDDISAKTG